MGLVIDYCVKFMVLDVLELGYVVNVIIDGCCGVNIYLQDSVYVFMEMVVVGVMLYMLVD